MNMRIEESVSEADVADLPDGVLIRYLAGIWADPDLRTVLEQNGHFCVERLRSYGRQGYLMPVERQALCTVLFAGGRSVHRRVQDVVGRRDESAAGMEAPVM